MPLAQRRVAPPLSRGMHLSYLGRMAERESRTVDDAPVPSFWLLQTAGWAAYGVAMALSRIGRFPFTYMFATKGMLTTVGFLITSVLLRPLYRRVLRSEPSLFRIIVITAVSSYVAAMLWTLGDNVFDIPIEQALLGRTVHFTSAWQLFGGTLYNAYTLLAWSLLYVGAKQYLALRDERERALRAEALAQSARLEALRYQLNPHFLFNTLNAVSTLVVEQRSGEASRMLARLADLLRATLDRPPGDLVPLTEELDLVRRYLDIEQIRLGDRLVVELDVSDDVWQARVPSLLLQPIVENAVRHAIAPRDQGGRITIGARRAADLIHLWVADDGPGPRTADHGAPGSNGGGIGLRNTKERLTQLYGGAHSFAITRDIGGGLRIHITIPYSEARAPVGLERPETSTPASVP